MSTGIYPSTPKHSSYDVVIVGGAMYGASVSWFLSDNSDFQGRVLVIERDSSYEFASTSHTNSCVRQQFRREINVLVSRFCVDFVQNLRSHFGGDERVPDLPIHSFGYMYLADTDAFAKELRDAQKLQQACGAATRLMSRDEIAQAYPFYQLDDIVAGSHNLVNEGYFDGGTVFDWWRRSGRERGVEYVENEVVSIARNRAGSAVESVTLKSGEVISCGVLVNASGPRAAQIAAMVDIALPVEPRKRYTYIFDAAEPLDRDLPLTIDPTGVHVRTDGKYYMAGVAPDEDYGVDYGDFAADHSLWENKVWPAIATRIPQFEAVKLVNSWVGHYAYNTLDQNAILGPHNRLKNFIFVNGFSGHGLQQSPAMGRGISELITYGEYRALDLSPFGYSRIETNEPFTEKAVI